MFLFIQFGHYLILVNFDYFYYANTTTEGIFPIISFYPRPITNSKVVQVQPWIEYISVWGTSIPEQFILIQMCSHTKFLVINLFKQSLKCMSETKNIIFCLNQLLWI